MGYLMNRYAYKTLVGIFMPFFLFGQAITVDAPRVVLKNIEFNIVYSGSFSQKDDVSLLVNGRTVFPSSITNETAYFNQVSVSKSGDVSFQLLQSKHSVYQFNRKVIPGWVSILPPLIAIILAFISRSVIPSLFAAIWFGVWSLSGFSIIKLVPALLDSFYHYTLNTMIDRDHAILILFTLMLGGMVGIIYRNGGMHGIIQQLIKKADTPKKVKLRFGYSE